jgi:HTH-type transcriptional regulator, transcriptional repressor of NAD biosynthesis genes
VGLDSGGHHLYWIVLGTATLSHRGIVRHFSTHVCRRHSCLAEKQQKDDKGGENILKRGLIVGKFYPPHAGHHYLIETGKQHCDEHTVMVCDRPEYLIKASLRAKWLREMHPDVTVRVIKDTLDDDDSEGWAAYARELMGNKIDIVFTSETYGEKWARFIGCEHYLVDLDRKTFHCSGTSVRKELFTMWQYLSPSIRAHFALRVAIVGAESTGKTTLAKDLAAHYRTPWVPEYGRIFTEEEVEDVWTHTWTEEDFLKIVKGQIKLEDSAAKQANKVLICDTDVFATSIWYKRYMGVRSPKIEKIATKRPPIQLYIVPDPTTPFDQDGYRDGEHLRSWMHKQFVDTLTLWGKQFVFVSGSPAERVQQATKAIDALLAHGTGISGKELHF